MDYHRKKGMRRGNAAFLLAMLVSTPAMQSLAADAATVVPAGVERIYPVKLERWSPDPRTAPVCGLHDDAPMVIQGNGTRTCCGGWQCLFVGVRGGQAYRFQARVNYKGFQSPRDSLEAIVLWDDWKPDQVEAGSRPWNYLAPHFVSDGTMDFQGILRAPPGATRLTVRYVLRWSEHGSSLWGVPLIEKTELPKKTPVKVCVVSACKNTTGLKLQPLSAGLGLPKDAAQSIDLWGSLILEACARKPQLVVTPETVIGGKHPIDGSLAVPGPATKPFERIARDHQVYLVLGMRERDGDAVYNSAVLVSPQGKVQGVYRKVHLATGEGLSGVSAGDRFPVFDTSIGRVGCMICMDTTVCESARLLALGGADFICFPIMGDLRTSRWSPGPSIFNEDAWKAIMRTRAIDNQVCMVIARNGAAGSCIIERKGDILAWNDGKQRVIEATLPADDGYRVWNGGDFREGTYLLRRPHLYGAFSDESNVGPLKPASPAR